MWIFSGVLYVCLALFFIVCDKKKRRFRKTVQTEEAFEHYLSGLSAAYGRMQNIADAKEEAREAYPAALAEDHPYRKIYDAVCKVVAEDGDELVDGYSVFQRNLQYLKEEIRANLLLGRAKQHEFTGLDILALLPVWFMPFAQIWAVHVSEGLAAYYEGSYGIVTTLVMFAATACIYGLILWLLLPADQAGRHYRLEEKLLGLAFAGRCMDAYIRKHYTKALRKNEQLKQLRGFGNVRAFYMRKVCFFAAGCLTGAALIRLTGAAGEGHGMWIFVRHIVFCAVTAVLFGAAPELMLLAGQWKDRERRMNECLRLQTIVLLMVHYERTTVEELLESMEAFAVVFRERIAEAVDSFSGNRAKALAQLKKDIPDEPVLRICEALEFCEELPVREAFANLEGEREYFLKKDQEERRNYQRESAALAKMAAYVPLFLLILLKLVVPFVAEGLSELGGYSREMMEFF